MIDDSGKEEAKNQEPEEVTKEQPLNQSELMSIINEVIAEGMKATSTLPFWFKNTVTTAIHNAKILKEHDFDLAKVLDRYSNTVFNPGTEFRPVLALQKLLGKHKDWPKLQNIITSGVRYGFKNDLKYIEKHAWQISLHL